MKPEEQFENVPLGKNTVTLVRGSVEGEGAPKVLIWQFLLDDEEWEPSGPPMAFPVEDVPALIDQLKNAAETAGRGSG
jgi:hypothetical protein